MKRIRRAAAVLTAAVTLFVMTVPCYAAEPVFPEMQEISEETASFYTQWKEKYLRQDPYITSDAQYYVHYSDEEYSGYSIAVTVSEAHGYGMLITACMAEQDSGAKEIFDGMYRYYRARKLLWCGFCF